MLRVFCSRLLVASTLTLPLALPPAESWAQPPTRASVADGARPESTVTQGGATRASRGAVRRDLWIAGATVAAVAVLLPLDERITGEFREPAPQRSAVLSRGARTFNSLGFQEWLVAGVGTYGLGRITGSRRVASLGAHATEAIVLSGAATTLLKGLAGRQRPFLDERDADEFKFGRGFGDGSMASFPSGHATASFAAAAAITAEINHSSRRAALIAGPLLFGGATLVGLSRIYDDKHWASDVVMGAGIGTLSGLAVTRYAFVHPNGRLERWLGIAVPAVGAGAAGGLTLTWHVARGGRS